MPGEFRRFRFSDVEVFEAFVPSMGEVDIWKSGVVERNYVVVLNLSPGNMVVFQCSIGGDGSLMW